MLDNQKTYTKFDPDQVGYGIEHLAEQVRMAWHDTRGMKLPSSYRHAKNVVVVGMGGSALGPEVLLHTWCKKFTVPVTIVRSYTLPSFVTQGTIVVLSSFSGTTEEVLAVADEARRRKLKVVVMTTGGALFNVATEVAWPTYCYTPGDLAREPRFALGFTMVGLLGILQALGLTKATDGDVRRIRSAMGDVLDTSAVDVPEAENPAKTVARALRDKPVMVFAAGHLVGNAHVFRSQLNETAKQFATYHALPEANHHFLEGLLFPKGYAKTTTAVMLRSTLYHDRVQKRFDVTADMLEKAGVQVVDYLASGKDALEECGEVLQFSSFVSYYLGLLNGVNVSAMPAVEEFKKQLE